MVATEMSRDEVDAFLDDQGTGVLSLADGAETYAVPESFGYDGEHLYFQLVYAEDSQKMAFIETTETATFTVSVETPARSVVVRGPLERVPDDETETATAAIAENAVLPTLNVVPDLTLEDVGMAYYRLVPRERSGRRFGVGPA